MCIDEFDAKINYATTRFFKNIYVTLLIFYLLVEPNPPTLSPSAWSLSTTANF